MNADATLDRARRAKALVAAELGSHPAVSGVGITRVGGGYAVKVNLRTEAPEGLVVPPRVDGIPVVVETVGPIVPR